MKFLALCKYSNAALAGLVANPDDDRMAVARTLIENGGGKMHDLYFLRGYYDAAVILEAKDFETIAAMKMVVMGTGSLEEMDIKEIVDFNSIAKKASKISGDYRPPGE
jgi:uncharacterized protein with GYD domain